MWAQNSYNHSIPKIDNTLIPDWKFYCFLHTLLCRSCLNRNSQLSQSLFIAPTFSIYPSCPILLNGMGYFPHHWVSYMLTESTSLLLPLDYSMGFHSGRMMTFCTQGWEPLNRLSFSVLMVLNQLHPCYQHEARVKTLRPNKPVTSEGKFHLCMEDAARQVALSGHIY